MEGRVRAVFTDLDGTLLGPGLSSGDAGRVLSKLQDLSVPVIPVTSKTLGEIVELGKSLPLGLVKGGRLYVAEMGGAVYATPGLLNASRVAPREAVGGLSEYPLARPLESFRALLDRILEQSGCREELTVVSRTEPNELAEVLGIPLKHARWAAMRKYDEVLVARSTRCARRVWKAALSLGLDVFVGRRHVHLGLGIGKGRALRILEEWLSHRFPRGVLGSSLCLGDSPIDWDFLEECKLGAVVPRVRGRWSPLSTEGLRSRFIASPYPAPRGWSWLVERYVLGLPPNGSG